MDAKEKTKVIIGKIRAPIEKTSFKLYMFFGTIMSDTVVTIIQTVIETTKLGIKTFFKKIKDKTPKSAERKGQPNNK